MDDLTGTLAGYRRRIRLARAGTAALRWGFHASVAACLTLAVVKFAGISLPLAAAGSVLLAVPVAMAALEWGRSFTLRDCAIHLDRRLGLEERLSTAMEAAGPMAPVVKADAAAAIGRSRLPSPRLPREAKLMAGSLVLAVVLAGLPSPERSGARSDRALDAVAAIEAARLESLANVDVRFKPLADKAAEELRHGRPEQALAALEDLERMLAEKMLEGGPTASETSKLLDQASASAEAVSAELARLGRTVHAPPPAVAQAKLSRQTAASTFETAPAPFPLRTSVSAAAVSAEIPWSPRYDAVVKKYRGH
ncbi:MAG TPA: hypothetical protein VE981_23670 [Planctomycetota bacterium]|nr:hypothetical protein [Planctomycetota bacterium]